MKRLPYALPLVLLLILVLCSCSNVDVPEPMDETAILGHVISANFISEQEAISIAKRIVYKEPTRNINSVQPYIQYVLGNTYTRSSSRLSDTLAYVINFPNNEGFALIASDNRVYPVLAFSNEGEFSFSNENATKNFILNIENYIDNASKTTTYEITKSDFDGCYAVEPIIQFSLGQMLPWNKYIIREYSACPVGYVAVATALVISHSIAQITYHGTTYPLKSIITAINKGPLDDIKPGTLHSPKHIVGGIPNNLPTYKYDQAVDSMAKILYLIGKDVNTVYTPDASYAFSEDAYELCKSLNLSISSKYTDFDIKEVTQYIKNGCIIYLSGDNIDGGFGHAWVSDGCYFCVDLNDKTKIIETYIHCDWGWGGSSNGYYSGSVFKAEGYNIAPKKYFAVKRDPLLSSESN